MHEPCVQVQPFIECFAGVSPSALVTAVRFRPCFPAYSTLSVIETRPLPPPAPRRCSATSRPTVTTPVLSAKPGVKAAGFRILLEVLGDRVEAAAFGRQAKPYANL